MKSCVLIFSRSVTYLILAVTLLSATGINTSAQAQQEETATAPRSGLLTGRVVTESGQPLPNATVSIRASVPLSQPRMTIADSDGNFRVTGLEPVLYGVFAASPSYITTPRDPDSQPDYYRIGDSITVSLVKGGVITGSVQSADGEPIVQIMVRAVMVRDANGQAPKYTAFQMQRPTDDRGIYRIYGLSPGTYVVGTGNRGFSGFLDPYDSDASTYAPSSTRDTAAEVTVRQGEETAGVDIRYRAEPGRAVSGFVSGLEPNSSSNITMFQLANGVRMSSGFAFQQSQGKGFAMHGVSDGDYELLAQASRPPGEISVSQPYRFTVKGSDVTGIELTLKPLSSISGRVILEKSEAAECKNKREPLFSETLLTARRSDKSTPGDQPRLMSFFASQGSPTKEGEFQLRNLAPGVYNLGARFFARYWFLRSISRDTPLVAPTVNKQGTAKRQIDLAKDGVLVKFGERQRDVTFTLTEGAGSLRGLINLAAGETIPPKLHVHLIPSEKENAEDVLRYFSDEVQADGSFSLNNLPPGRYWAIAVVASAKESQLKTAIRLPEEKELRARLRRSAEAAKTEIELKPCQNITDYSLSRR